MPVARGETRDLSHGLFEMRLAERVELRTPAEREIEVWYGVAVPPRVLRKGEKVAVLDFSDAEHALCMTRHGKAMLDPRKLR